MVCVAGTARQLSYWQNSIRLFSHAVEATTDNYAAEVCLGEVLEPAGQDQAAFELYSDAVRIEPDYPLGQFKLGMMLLARGKPDDAFVHLQAAVQLMPHNPDLQYDLGVFLRQHGQPADAVVHFKAALDDRPDFPEALNELAWILSTNPDPKLRSGAEAIQLARHAGELTQNQKPALLTTLSAAYAETGQFPEAIVAAQKARDLAVATGQTNIAAQAEALLDLYRAGHSFQETR
jgi:predicted Zn-dependent protease